jgi:hypothetical protein
MFGIDKSPNLENSNFAKREDNLFKTIETRGFDQYKFNYSARLCAAQTISIHLIYGVNGIQREVDPLSLH